MSQILTESQVSDDKKIIKISSKKKNRKSQLNMPCQYKQNLCLNRSRKLTLDVVLRKNQENQNQSRRNILLQQNFETSKQQQNNKAFRGGSLEDTLQKFIDQDSSKENFDIVSMIQGEEEEKNEDKPFYLETSRFQSRQDDRLFCLVEKFKKDSRKIWQAKIIIQNIIQKKLLIGFQMIKF